MGERVPLVLRVANTGTEPVTLYLMGRTPTADFQISDSHGRTIWSRLRGKVMLASLRLFPLGAGGELVLRHTWDGRADAGAEVTPGHYEIRAVLLTDEPAGLATAPSRIRFER